MATRLVIPQSAVLDTNGRLNREWQLFFLAVADAAAAAGGGSVTNAADLDAGQLVIGAGGDAIETLPVSTNGYVATLVAGVAAWAPASGGMTNPMTTLGDIIVGGVAGAPTRLAATTDGFVLTLAAGTPAWAAGASGGGLTRGEVQALFQLPVAL